MAVHIFHSAPKSRRLAYFEGKPHPALLPAAPEEAASRAATLNPLPNALLGFGGLALMLWLMIFKPF